MGSNKKKRGPEAAPKAKADSIDKPVTLKDMLGTATVAKLKQHADELKQQEANLQEQKRQEAEAARTEQQKLNEKNFEYLLNHSDMDWKKHK